MHKVRPTLRALHDMGMTFPVLTQPLGEIDHPVVRKSQEIPGAHRAGSAERIRLILDRPVFKVKADSWRAAAAYIASSDVVPSDAANPPSGSAWWILAAGHRQSDTPQQDFYARLAEECARAAKHTEAPANSDALLPQRIDYQRRMAEAAALAIERMRATVRQAVCRSAQNGAPWTYTVGTHEVTAHVQTTDGDTYLAIAAQGYLDPKVFAVILDAVPGVPREDWSSEPGEVLGIVPRHVQVVFSTMLPSTALAAMLEEHDENYL